jgi:predicted PurR-regulated permease PerM
MVHEVGHHDERTDRKHVNLALQGGGSHSAFAWGAWVTAISAAFVSGSVWGVITIVITFYLLFYFLRDRGAALNWLRKISPSSRSSLANGISGAGSMTKG